MRLQPDPFKAEDLPQVYESMLESQDGFYLTVRDRDQSRMVQARAKAWVQEIPPESERRFR